MKKQSVIDKYKNQSPAFVAKEIDKKYPNRDTDLVEKESFHNELNQLYQHQEKMKKVEELKGVLKQFKQGGMLPKYVHGTPPNGIPEENGVPLADPFGGDFLPPSPIIDPMYGTRPETILGYAKTSMTPGVAVRPFDDTAFGTTRETPSLFGNAPTISNSLGMSTPRDAPKTKGEMSAYAPALVGQGLSTIINAGILAGGADKVAPVDNPYESQVKNLMASRGIDTTQQRNQILSSYNAAKEGINNSRSANVRNALDANLMNINQDSLAESKLQEQVANNGFKSDYAQTLNNLGQQKAQAQIYAETATAQNKSTFENNLSYFGDLMAQHGESFSAFKANQNMNTSLGQLLNDKYASSNLGISQDTIDKFNSGKATEQDWIELKSKIKGANPALTIPEFKPQ